MFQGDAVDDDEEGDLHTDIEAVCRLFETTKLVFQRQEERHHFFKPDADIAKALLEKSCTVGLTPREHIEILFHDGSHTMFGNVSLPTSVLWQAVRKLVKVRGIALFLQKLAVERACQPGGRVFREDIEKR